MTLLSRFLTLSSILAGLSVSCLSPTLLAADSLKDEEMKHLSSGACKADMNQYCKDITPGQGRMMACLKSHEDKLSPACSKEWKSAKTHMKKEWKEARQACGGDVQKFCKEATGHKEVSQCLNQHMSQLSGSCKNYQTSMKDKMPTHRTG
jgi:hypothetical protein